MPPIRIRIRAFVGMDRNLPPTLLHAKDGAEVVLYEAVGMDPSEPAILTPRPAIRAANQTTGGFLYGKISAT